MANKKGKAKRVIITLMVVFVFIILALIYGYIDFEFKKIGETGITPLSDWRSYISYLLEKVPVVKNYVEYTPRQVIKPQQYYSEIYETYIEKIEEDRVALEQKAKQLNAFEEELNQLQGTLAARQEELDLMEERLVSEKTAWESTKERFQNLADWFENGDVALLAQAIASDEIGVEEIVGGLRLIDPGIAASIVGELAQINQDKAGRILANLSGKEVTR